MTRLPYARWMHARGNGGNQGNEDSRGKPNGTKHQRRNEEPPKDAQPRAERPTKNPKDADDQGKHQPDAQYGEHGRRKENGHERCEKKRDHEDLPFKALSKGARLDEILLVLAMGLAAPTPSSRGLLRGLRNTLETMLPTCYNGIVKAEGCLRKSQVTAYVDL